MTSTAEPDPPGGGSEKQALLEAFDDVLRADAARRAEEAERRAASAKRSRRISPIVLASVFALLGIGTGAMATRPAWLGFGEPYVEPPVVQDASLRLSIYRARQQVELFRRERQQLPATLREAGVSDPSLRMTVVSSSQYVIEGGNDSVRLALRSDEPVRPFLGDAYDVIVRGRSE